MALQIWDRVVQPKKIQISISPRGNPLGEIEIIFKYSRVEDSQYLF